MTPGMLTAYKCFLRAEVSRHTHALTLTLKNDSPTESYQNRRIRLEETVRHLLYRIARRCFKNRHKRCALHIASATVIEGGNSLGRLHAHLSLAAPNGVPDDQFVATVVAAVQRCKSLGPKFVIKRITDSDGWADYMAKEGLEGFSSKCTQRVKF